MVRVTVKWQKNSYDVDVDTSEPPAMFKFQLYSLTAVPPERQKIMIKGGTLKDDTDWAKVDLKEGQKLMMMGTADKVSFSWSRCKFNRTPLSTAATNRSNLLRQYCCRQAALYAPSSVLHCNRYLKLPRRHWSSWRTCQRMSKTSQDWASMELVRLPR